MKTARISIDELAIPSAPGAPVRQDFVAATHGHNVVETEGYGTTDLNYSAEEMLSAWLNKSHEPKRLFGARVDGRVVARAVYEALLDPAVPFAWLTVRVLPKYRRRGIGTALADRVESLARDEGRRVQVTYVVSKEAPGERISSPTGYGSVPLANPEVRFLLGRGYALEQVERGSRLALPVDVTDLALLLLDAAPYANADYGLEAAENLDATGPERCSPQRCCTRPAATWPDSPSSRFRRNSNAPCGKRTPSYSANTAGIASACF